MSGGGDRFLAAGRAVGAGEDGVATGVGDLAAIVSEAGGADTAAAAVAGSGRCSSGCDASAC